MDQGSKNRRRYPRLFRNVRFLFYFLGQTREVYTVDISYNGAFIQTDVFPPLGSFIILEHYHLKKRNVTLGLVGKIRRIQTPFQSSPSVRGVGVEWVRCYCNQGFLPLKQFLERDLGYQPFDWDTHLTYEEYDRKIVYDFASCSLSPTPEELTAIVGTRRRVLRTPEADPGEPIRRAESALADDATDAVWRRPTRPVAVQNVPQNPSGLRPGFAEDTLPPSVQAADPAGPAPASAPPGFERASTAPTPIVRHDAPPTSLEPTVRIVVGAPAPMAPDPTDLPTPPQGSASGPAESPTAPPARPTAPPDLSSADSLLSDDLFPVDIKVVFGIGNRMFYGVVHGVGEHELLIETTSPQVVKANARIQVRLPLNAKNYRYMVVIYGRIGQIDDRDEDSRSFRLRIESLDEFQNPGGFRFFLQTLAR